MVAINQLIPRTDFCLGAVLAELDLNRTVCTKQRAPGGAARVDYGPQCLGELPGARPTLAMGSRVKNS